ncbi:helix-turn-helix domain-containing protein [Actinacidiphila sp. bgisy160]|uniref:helix-turn-helix domain-containing protein n=1 Tax=Actinacidiphila sp. bgisy160 TaxID=3413796 RepID=UPI003D740488
MADTAMAAALDQALHANGQLIALAAMRPGLRPLEQVAALQHDLRDTLAAGPVSSTCLDEWAYTVARHGRATRYRPERELLPELLADIGDLRHVLAHRHPEPARRRLIQCLAQLAGLMALTLLKLGDPAARDWWRTGRAAAAAGEDRTTLAWMYAQEAYQLYYGGDLHGAVELAARARHYAGGLPCVGAALAAPLGARALAQLGHGEETAAALEAAEAALERLPAEQRIGSAFGYSEAQLAFHSGNAWTHLGNVPRAAEQHERALGLYPDSDHTDRTLIRLDQAMCRAHDGDAATAAALATETIVTLPPAHRSALIIYRAREVAARVPETQAVSEVRVLREILALPPGERAGMIDGSGDAGDGEGRRGDLPAHRRD